MAKAGAKKQVQENKARLELLKKLLLFANAWYVVVRLVVLRSSATWSTYFGLLFISGIDFFCFTSVTRMAEPLYGDNGELLDGGADLLHGGISEYYQDIIFLNCFVQVACVVTEWAWWAYLLVPLVAAYILYVNVAKPFFSAPKFPKEATESEAERKRREKAERKAGRPKMRQMR